jgi:hypothetical protein
MWHFLIGPQIDPKMLKMSDTWQPLVLPHQHVDMSWLTLTWLTKLCLAITSSSGLRLTNRLHRWKYFDTLFVMMPIFLSFDGFDFFSLSLSAEAILSFVRYF